MTAAGPPAGEFWIAPLPQCPTHGRMHLDADADTWTCPGYDGEGCDTPPVRTDDADWRPGGTIDVRTLGLRLP